MGNLNHYGKLAPLFTYPDQAFYEKVEAAQEFLNAYYPEAGELMNPFAEFVSNTALTVLEELYTRSFDVQAITTLDIGYVLFGDDYKRGALLVNLNREHKEAGNDCQSELADHLSNILRLLDKMEKPELREELVQKIVAPALRKIILEFEPDKVQAKNKVYQKHHKTLIAKSNHYGTIYQLPLKALYHVLNKDFHMETAQSSAAKNQDFLKSVNNEISIETLD